MGLYPSKPVLIRDPNYDHVIDTLRSEAREFKKQITSLKIINASLEKQRIYESESKNLTINKSQNVKLSELSEQKINDFVDEILQNKEINIGYFPDFVERRIYKNVFTILVNLLDHVVDTTSVKLLGHEINFTHEESKENEESNETNTTL